jgi:hypothetical protein
MPKIETLAEALEDIDKRPWNHALFVEGACPWRGDSRCAVLDPDESDDAEEDPPFATEHGLTYVLTMADAQSVAKNVKQQMPSAGPRDLVRAFNFYVRNDAFIRINASGEEND